MGLTDEHRKKYAQFFTPPAIARYMGEWVRECRSVLDPAIGLGVLVAEARKVAATPQEYTAYDVDPVILGLLSRQEDVRIECCDFLSTSPHIQYDGAIVNPPYKKFQDYDNSVVSKINGQCHIRLTRLTNLYALFVVRIIHQLKTGGRASVLVPSEFLNCGYGVEVKRALLPHLTRLVVLDFPVFDDALTTACVMFLEKDHVGSVAEFALAVDIDHLGVAGRVVQKSTVRPEDKWRMWEGLEQASANLVPLSTYARVSRGIVTGGKPFFAVSEPKRQAAGLPAECVIACLTKSTQVKHGFFTMSDLDDLRAAGEEVSLLDLERSDCHAVKTYIDSGEAQSIHTRYLTRNRTPWYALERRQPPDLIIGVFNRDTLKVVVNHAGVLALNCFHCLYFHNLSQEERLLLTAYLLTPTANRILLKNRRTYADNLIKFEPKDLSGAGVIDLSCLSPAHRNELVGLSVRLESDIGLLPAVNNIFSLYLT